MLVAASAAVPGPSTGHTWRSMQPVTDSKVSHIAWDVHAYVDG